MSEAIPRVARAYLFHSLLAQHALEMTTQSTPCEQCTTSPAVQTQ